MGVGFLVSAGNGNGGERVAVGSGLVIGRAPTCGFVIDDPAASRHHVEIVSREGRFLWKDLGSSNGTFLNDRSMVEGELKAGDEIRIGSTILRFEVDEGSSDDGAAFNGTMLDAATAESLEHGTTDKDETDRLLEAVYSVMNDMAADYDPCGLVDRILETTMRAIDGHRGAVLFSESPDSGLLPCPVCGSVHTIEDGVLSHANVGDFPISGTVVKRVLENGESVLYEDTTEPDFVATRSMVSLELRSVICVPIRGKERILGVLYIDSSLSKRHYSHAHMLLSNAVGNSAGLALDNARMHQEILERQRLLQEIEFAGIIQEGFLVSEWPEDSRIQIYGKTWPAKTVGGDFYDFIYTGPDKVGILIGDVSGKGVPAALAMAQLLAEFRAAAIRDPAPASVVDILNKSLERRSRRGMFCTACYLLIDLQSGTVTSATAGHHATLRINDDGVSAMESSAGPPLGILAEFPWQEDEDTLRPGECVFLYTDGIVEARSGAADGGFVEYGEDRLMACLGNHRGVAPQEIIGHVHDDVTQFSSPAGPHDDCTYLALRFLG